jgi:hypothetical protein
MAAEMLALDEHVDDGQAEARIDRFTDGFVWNSHSQ